MLDILIMMFFCVTKKNVLYKNDKIICQVFIFSNQKKSENKFNYIFIQKIYMYFIKTIIIINT